MGGHGGRSRPALPVAARESERVGEEVERMGRSSASALEEPGALGRAAARPGAAHAWWTRSECVAFMR
jgi:hypothetical protein